MIWQHSNFFNYINISSIMDFSFVAQLQNLNKVNKIVYKKVFSYLQNIILTVKSLKKITQIITF